MSSLSSRHIENSSAQVLNSLPTNKPLAHLQECLDSILKGYTPLQAIHGRPQGLMSGPTSVAYLFLQLCHLVPDLSVLGHKPDHWCKAYLHAAHTLHSRHKYSSRPGGIQDEDLAYAAVKAAFTGDSTYVTRAADLADSLAEDLEPDVNEWLYGRAGSLYLLRLVKHFVPAKVSGLERIDVAIKHLAEHILARDEPWAWHGKEYLGAVHGDIGIVTQLVLSAPSLAPKLEGRLQGLLKKQFPSGNWPSSNGSSRDELVQFCHGAPGFVVALLALRDHFPGLQGEIDAAIEKGRQDIWRRGLLTKEPNLCHGISGNALAMDEEPREKMLRMATPTAIEQAVKQGIFAPGSEAYGLLSGEAGRAWSWLVAAGKAKGFIGFTDV